MTDGSPGVLSPLAATDAARLRRLFAAAGYTEDGVAELVGTVIPLPANHHQRAQLVQLTDRPVPLHCLTRLFFLGEPLIAATATAVLPQGLVDLCREAGLLAADGPLLRPEAVLSPVEGLWIAADLDQHRLRRADAGHVLGINPPALNLLKFAIRRPVEVTLDLCSGNALHALVASRFSRQVVASDLSQRAAMYARFNAALNGCDFLECLEGDLFAPVGQRRFDLILCNPPFEVSPAREFLYRDGGLELDGFCERVVREAPAYLNEGGFCQVVAEWVELEGQDWQDRLRGWLRGNGCDAWVLAANRLLPETYVLDRAREFDQAGAGQQRQWMARWLEYLGGHGVQSIHAGVITLRRRAGRSWVSFGELVRDVRGPVGSAVLQGFASRDFLAQSGDAEVLASRPRVSPAVRLEQVAAWEDGGWQTRSARLRLDEGVPVNLGVDPNIRDMVERFDGWHSAQEVLDAFAADLGVPVSAVRGEFVRIVRLMVEHACLLV